MVKKRLWARIFIYSMLLLMYAPILLLIAFSFTDSTNIGTWNGFSLDLYKQMFQNEEIMEALKQAQAWEFVEKLEQGLDTVIGDKGVRLSGGQRQRIVLAKVLLGKPKLIILDEATSALDYESENAVRETIRSLKGKATVLIIAHRLATIRGADRAIVLEHGQVAEEGSMQELSGKADGYLSRMLAVE